MRRSSNVHSKGDEQNHEVEDKTGWKSHLDLIAAFIILVIILVAEYAFKLEIPNIYELIINATAYLLAGRKILNLAFRKSIRGDIFNEFVLMSVATIGAFIIGEYEEGVAVMVFYQIGEWFQDAAVNRAKRSIKALLDIRPNEVTIIRNGETEVIDPAKAELGEIIQVKPGEKVALDGELISENASFNTAALTGESKPDTKRKGEQVLAGMFAKIYTPIVFFLAVAVCFFPYFFIEDYVFNIWFYRALVFLVISCPCALVVSIPLGYFGGIGLASRNGILFKGGNFLDVMTKIDTIVMDKTGTLTKGVFKVQKVVAEKIDETELIQLAATLEKNSTHPVGQAIIEYAGDKIGSLKSMDVEEISGHGLKGIIEGKKILAGNLKLLKKFNISYPEEIEKIVDTIVVVAINGIYSGYVTIADEIKEDSINAIKEMHALNIKTVMLSGDKQSVVDDVAKDIGIDVAYGDLLPEGKVEKVHALKNAGKHIAFVGDGINDAPVVALADAGMAMGGLGSDATIETADIVIQNDQPTKIVSAIKIGKITRNIVWQNIILAMIVKVFVLILGAGGLATLWEAVIADVGVALLAILNAVRIQKINV